MSSVRRVLSRAIAVAVVAASAGCSSGGPASVTEAGGLVTVVGQLTAIDDATPVDGGVTLTVAVQGEAIETLTFGSLFTSPPPGEERIALYQRIAEAEVGGRVRATGERREAGIEIVAFEILES
ncbi:hypothetical protein [Gaopeijia maritima]|uniref:hypothetical protein n=1 Tax=Gaopeijia maritima TaxID=3119007 RepID=UPI0038671FD4